jgi:hypothetical protein
LLLGGGSARALEGKVVCAAKIEKVERELRLMCWLFGAFAFILLAVAVGQWWTRGNWDHAIGLAWAIATMALCFSYFQARALRSAMRESRIDERSNS